MEIFGYIRSVHLEISWASQRLHQQHHRDLLPLQLAIALSLPKVTWGCNTGATRPKPNIAPENRLLEKEIPIGNGHVYGLS